MKSKLVEQTGSLRLVESKVPKKGCLGRLEGPCADFKNATRNGRLYGLQLWKNVFSNKFVKEALATKTLFGELDHPEDRFEVLAKYACVCMTDYRIDESDGIVYGGFDILDTEAGRILKSLVDYGSQMGVSSRGEGDVKQGDNGEEVDPDTYDFACFDVVSTPAVEKARQTVVESVEHSRKKRQLIESIEREIKKADTVEVLDNIERTVTNCNCPNLSRIKRSIDNRKSQINEGKNISSVTPKINSNDFKSKQSSKPIKTINEDVNRETVDTISELTQRIRAYKLREKHLTNSINNYKEQIKSLNEQLDKKNKTNSLHESNQKRLEVVNATAKQKISNYQKDITDLKETINSLKKERRSTKVLNETLNTLRDELKTLKNENQSLQDKLDESENIINSYKDRQKQLKDSLCEQKRLNEDLNNNQNNIIEDKDNNIQVLKETNRSQFRTIKEQEDNINQLDTYCADLEQQYKDCYKLYKDLMNENTSLKEQINKLSDSNTKLTEKFNKSLALNKTYTDTFLTEYAKSNGVNPNNVLLNESISNPATIKKLVAEVKDKQDRYNKLPISYAQPTTINILNENINRNGVDEEDSRIESFLTSVQTQL